RGGVMPRKSKKGRMPAGLRRYWAAVRAGKRRAPNPHKKRAAVHHSRAGGYYKKKPRRHNTTTRDAKHVTRRRRRNPEGLRGLPTTIFWLGAGAVGTRFAMSKLPWKIPIGGVWGTWATEVAVAILAPKLLHRFIPSIFNQNAAALMMYGGL